MSEIKLEMLEEQVLSIICRITGMESKEITRDGHLYQDFGIDSIKAIELLVSIQEKFNIRVDDSKVQNLITVAVIAEEIKRLLEKKK